MNSLSLGLSAVVAAVQLVAGHGQSVRKAADSARLIRSVRSAQFSFESFRRSALPLGEHTGGLCDVRIGRYCYWRGDDEEPDPPAEPEAIRRRRASLIRVLDSAATILPGDPWLGGQLVRYLVEDGRYDEAIGFSDWCAADRSWCLALAGYAAHSGGRFELADTLFSASLASLPPDERCRWLDVSDVIDGELADAFKKVGCADRERFVRRILRIAAPLYSVSTTDLLTEHLSRLTRARIAERSATTDGVSWADDQRELVVRYGWPRWYSRWEPEFDSGLQRSITGHDTGMPFDFIPSLHAVQHVSEATDDDWHLDEARAITGYAPSFAKSIHALPSQIARFRRGDSTLVFAAWDARQDTSLLGRTIDAALVVLDDSTTTISRLDSVRTRGHITLAAHADSGIISLELLAPKERRAARSRKGFVRRTSDGITLSDLLLYASGDSTPTTLAAAADSALTSTEIVGVRPVGVYWETYGLNTLGKHVHYTLTVEEVEVGWMRRAAARVHLVDPTRELRIQWDEHPLPSNGIAGRGVQLDLSQLRHGKYRIELAATPDDGPTATTNRVIEVK